MGHSVCGVAVALYAIRNRCPHNPLAHPPWCGCTLKRAAQAGRRRALQRLRSVLPGRALSPGRVGVAPSPGRLFGPALERCRPALLVRHGGRPGGGDGHDAPVGGACNVGAGPALDRVGHWLRCAAGRAGAAAGAMTGGTPDLIAVRAMCTGATRHFVPNRPVTRWHRQVARRRVQSVAGHNGVLHGHVGRGTQATRMRRKLPICQLPRPP